MERVAVVGIGQTEHRAKRQDVSIPGLLREAAARALADAELEYKDIDAVVIGKAPDMFEGVMMPELFLADALGAVGKPILRVHTAGSVGGSTAIVASHLVSAGHSPARAHGRVRETVGERGDVGALSQDPVSTSAHRRSGRLLRAARARVHPPRPGAGSRRNAGRGERSPERAQESTRPSADPRDQPRDGQGLAHALGSDPLSRDLPVLGRCVRDGADQRTRRNPRSTPAGVGSRERDAQRAGDVLGTRPGQPASRPRLRASDLYAQARITDPLREIDAAELYVPFSWFEPMWLENLGFCREGEGWKLTERGATALDGELPVNPSGGVLCSNPIGASGMLRFAEAALQVRGQAGEHQVGGARRAMGHAYGGGSQFFAMWIVGSEKP